MICARMGIAAGEAGKLPRLHIQQNIQAISKVACLCPDFLLGLSQSPRKWTFLFLSLFLERATLDLYPFYMSTPFYSSGPKSAVMLCFVWSQLYCHSQAYKSWL